MTWIFRCESNKIILLPPEGTFAQAFNYLDEISNSYYILENGDNYIQCGGSKKMCTVELREYLNDGSFKHYVFFDPKGSNDNVHILMSDGGVYRKRKHCFPLRTAIKLFDCFFNSEPWPADVGLEDMASKFTESA